MRTLWMLGRFVATTSTPATSVKIGDAVARNCVDWAPEGVTPLNTCPSDGNGTLHWALPFPLYFYGSTAEPPAEGAYPCAGRLANLPEVLSLFPQRS